MRRLFSLKHHVLPCANIVAALAVLVACSCELSETSLQPRLILWAWQRTEKLDFINPQEVAVALWVGSITLSGATPEVTSRQNRVTYPQGSELIAVIRLELPAQGELTDTAEVAALITGLAGPWQAAELQLDFDARVSQRPYYTALINELRRRNPGTKLSITALASWCLGDPWLATLAIDAAVPMLYRMGSDGIRINQILSAGGHFSASICENNVGYALDEIRVAVSNPERIFIYSPAPWTEQTYNEITDEMRQLYP